MEKKKLKEMRDVLQRTKLAALQNAVKASSNFMNLSERFCEGEDVEKELKEAYKEYKQRSSDVDALNSKINEYNILISKED